MKDFYVKLTSGSNRFEFPDNKAARFKNRLPYLLQFKEPGWKVGMADIHVPRAPRPLAIKDPFLFQFRWHFKNGDTYNAVTLDILEEQLVHLRPHITNGTQFMTAVKRLYYQQLHDLTVAEDQLGENVKDEDGEDEFKRYYTQMYRTDDQFFLDNSETYTGDTTRYPQMFIGFQLAKDMGWIKEVRVQDPDGDMVSVYSLGNNLRKEFPEDMVYDETEIEESAGEFFKVDHDALQLSCYCSWVFSYLDEGYEKAFGANQRQLFVYSNIVQSIPVGVRMTNLLGDIPYSLERRGYEMQHIRYIPVRGELLDIVEIVVKEEDDAEVHFEAGNTVVTLHFKYVG